MRRRLAPAMLLATVLALTPMASARADDIGSFSFSTFFVSGPGVRQLSETDLQVSISGAVAVDYHGSESAGCARLGLCGVSGNAVWDPGSAGVLAVIRYMQHGKHRLQATLTTGARGPGRSAATVTRQTPAGPEAVCGDAQSGGSYSNSTSHSLAAISVRLMDSSADDLLTTHCAGPLASDLVKLLPVRPLARMTLDGSSTKTIDLSTTRPFDADGFAGVLRSTVVLRVGPKVPEDRETRQFLQQTEKEIARLKRRVREVEASYKVTGVSGELSTTFHGTGSADLCAGLDSCGSSGTLVVAPSAAKGEFQVDADALARRPARDVRAPFGLAHGGTLRGVRISGYGDWLSSSGSVTSTVTHDDGGATCADTVPMHHGVLAAFVERKRLLVSYYLGGGAGDAEHTRCPGPLLGDLSPLQHEAQGSAPVSVLRHKRITLHLKLAPAPFSAPGYSGTTQQDITVTLRRTSVRQRTRELPF